MSGDLCISPIKPRTPVHLYPWCLGPSLEWRRHSVHGAKLLSPVSGALKIKTTPV